MFAKFFGPQTMTTVFRDTHLFDTDKIVSFDYTKRFFKVGEFSMVLPLNTDFLKKLSNNCMINVGEHWLWITGISYDEKQISLTGKDCKGFLENRIALYGSEQESGTYGYDVVSGTTSECIEHYLNDNCIAPNDSERKLPLTFVSSGVSGIIRDHYMARFETIAEITAVLCENADIGYEVYGNLNGGGFRFRLINGVDRSFKQSERARVLLSAKKSNVSLLQFEHGIDNLLNVIYGTGSDGFTSTVYRDRIPTGIERRECNMSVSTSISDEHFNDYVLKAAADNVESHSFEINVPYNDYGTEYSIGDTISVWDSVTNNIYNRRINEVSFAYSAGQQTITLVLGTPKQKYLDRVINSMISGTARRR